MQVTKGVCDEWMQHLELRTETRYRRKIVATPAIWDGGCTTHCVFSKDSLTQSSAKQ
jgi:hypothetical protein